MTKLSSPLTTIEELPRKNLDLSQIFTSALKKTTPKDTYRTPNIHKRANMKKLIAPFVLDVLVATAGTYVAVSQLLEGFSWLAVSILATLAGANIFAAFKLGTNGRLKFSSTAAAGAVLLAWMIYVSNVSGVDAMAVIGMVVGCAQIAIAVVAGKNGADSSEAKEDIEAKLPLLAALCVALGIGLGILSLLPGHNIDSDRAIWLLGLAVVLLAISRIAEMKN